MIEKDGPIGCIKGGGAKGVTESVHRNVTFLAALAALYLTVVSQ